MNLIADKIKENRKIKGLTQEELAEKATINLRTIQRIENAESEPRGKTLKLISDVLEIDLNELVLDEKSIANRNLTTRIANGILILLINFLLIGIIGFLTLDSNANMNSLFGGVLLSILMPLFIVHFTREMSKIERMLKFGAGCIFYFMAVLVLHGLPIGFKTGLFPCLFISLFFLYFGNEVFKPKS
ncbi:MAG: helix-turn-helix domain-containing protein [Bacteroidota bacterium]